MNIDPRLIAFVKRVKLPFLLTLVFAIIAAVAVVAQAYYLSTIIDSSFLKHKTLYQLLNPLFIFILILLARFLAQWFSDHFASQLSAKIRYQLRNQLSFHLQKLSPVMLAIEKRGELSNTLQQGVDALDAYFRSYLPQLFKAATIPLLILIFVFPLDLLSGIVFLFTAPVIPVFMMLIGQLAKKATQKQWRTLSHLSAYLLDMIEGLSTLKILNRSQFQITRIKKLSEQFRQSTMAVLRIAFLSALVLEMAATISTAVVAVEIGLRLLYAKLPFSEALFILILAPEYYQPMRQLGASFHAGMEGVEAAQRIFEIFKLPTHLPVSATHSSKLNTFSTIRFEQVSFQYPNSLHEALHDVQLTFEQGKKYVIIGPSGAGKSTIFNLLLKFIAPTQGRIVIDGKDLQQIATNDWYQHISWIAQKPYLFHDTIEANLKLVKPQATKNEIQQAVRKAQLHTVIEQLPDGYQTIIGEHGTQLSAGQAQRLALARVFLKDAPLILLDEPTANLDPDLDREISQIIQQLPAHKTQIIIAHRFTTLKKADQIIALSKGEIVEIGTFHQLQQPGHYLQQLVQQVQGGVT